LTAEPPDIWAIPGFREFMLGMIAVTLANQIQGTVVAYQIYELTRDPLSLGAVGLAEALPFVSLALLGGHVADARDRRRISLVVLVVMFAMSLGLLGLTFERGALGAVRHKFAIYGIIVVLGVCRSFLQPARAALNAELLPPSLYAKAIAIRTSLFQLAMVSGPAGGGLLYAAVGPQGAYIFSGVLLTLAWSCMFRIPRVRPAQAVKSALSVAHSIGEGFKYLASDRLLLSALLLDLFGVLFGGATALLPVFANEILAVGSRGFGVLRAAPATQARRAHAARGHHGLWFGHHRFWAVEELRVVDRAPGAERRARHGERRRAQYALANARARALARPRRVHQSDLHRLFERDRRVRIGRGRAPARRHSIRGFWRRNDVTGHRHHGLSRAGAAQARALGSGFEMSPGAERVARRRR
jgi:hypothetical protein